MMKMKKIMRKMKKKKKKQRRKKKKKMKKKENRNSIKDLSFIKNIHIKSKNYRASKKMVTKKNVDDVIFDELKNFKSFIYGGDSTRWYKTKLKFQTDSQKAFTLDMINKEIEKKDN